MAVTTGTLNANVSTSYSTLQDGDLMFFERGGAPGKTTYAELYAELAGENFAFTGTVNLTGSTLSIINKEEYPVTGGAADAYTLTPSPAWASLITNGKIVFQASATNTGASTINVSGLGARDLRKISADSGSVTALEAGDIVEHKIYTAIYDGTRFVVRETDIIIDEDSFASNEAKKAPSQQSTKAYVDAQVAAIDLFADGQTWQDVSVSRAVNTSYQNTTGKPIMVAIGCDAGGDVTERLQVSTNGSTWVDVAISSSNNINLQAVVPDNHYYRFNGTITIATWAELR